MTHYKAAAFSCSILEMAQRAFLRGTLCFAVRRLLKAALETAAAQNFAGRQSESKSRLIAEFRDQIAVPRAKRPRPSWEAIAELMRPALDASPDTWRKAYGERKRKRVGSIAGPQTGRRSGNESGKKSEGKTAEEAAAQIARDAAKPPSTPPPPARVEEHAATRNAGRKT